MNQMHIEYMIESERETANPEIEKSMFEKALMKLGFEWAKQNHKKMFYYGIHTDKNANVFKSLDEAEEYANELGHAHKDIFKRVRLSVGGP